MVQISRLIAFLSVASLGLALVVQRDATQVEGDLTKISAQVTTLDNAILAFPETGGTLTQALFVHNDAIILDTDIKTATTDATASGPFGAASDAILDQVQNLEPLIDKTLNDLIAKKAAFAALSVGGITALVLADLETLQKDTELLASALENKISANDLAALKAATATIDGYFNQAIAVYKTN
ncbi:hydrophobic surface binding protein [Mycena maculata]|uniref:Hydrophobic surface binding protein n=1 Tax=Mycena maculata TaxID=230809 RepID=A0AAD7INJ0_9AGAR|nr:hydrophobic surface binding protein [Mycena maculata]